MGAIVWNKWVQALCPVSLTFWQLLCLIDDSINTSLYGGGWREGKLTVYVCWEKCKKLGAFLQVPWGNFVWLS